MNKLNFFSLQFYIIYSTKNTIILSGKYQELYQQLAPTIDLKRIFYDPLHTLAFGTDASFYRLIPKMIIKTVSKKKSHIS